jgi:hypothetical protein
MEFGPVAHREPENGHRADPGCLVEPRSGLEAALRWARAAGVRPGPTAAPVCSALVEGANAWLAGQGYGVTVSREHVGHAFRALGCRRGCGDVGVLGYRVPRALADSWWAAVGGRPKRKKRAPKPKPQQRAVKPLFHMGLNPASRPLLDSLGRVYPSLGAAAAVAGEGEGNWKGLHNALKPVRSGEALWGRWRGVLWRYLSSGETALVPWGTRTGAVPEGWGFGPLRGQPVWAEGRSPGVSDEVAGAVNARVPGQQSANTEAAK